VTKSRTAGDKRGGQKRLTMRRVPGRKKASWLPRRRSSSRRASRRGPRSARHTEGVSIRPKQHRDASTTEGCSTSWEEGSHLSPFAGTAYEREGRPFARGSSAHAHTSLSPQPSSAQPTVGFMVPPRTRRREERRSLALHSQAELAPFRERRRWCGVARCPPSLEREGGYRMPRTPTKRARKAGADATAQSGNVLTAGGERRGLDRSRSCSRVVLSRSRSRQLVVWRKEAGVLHFIRFGERSGTGA